MTSLGFPICNCLEPLRIRNRSRAGACPPPRNVAAKEFAVTNSLKSATLWGGVGGGETRQIAVPRPVNGYPDSQWRLL